MKILWIGPGFLHPTTRGGQIRTLEMLRRLRLRHEIHYLGLDGANDEALARQPEYCSKVWTVPGSLAPRTSLWFWMQSVRFLFSKLPIVVARRRSPAASALIRKLLLEQNFDLVVCDFLTPAIHIPPDQPFVLFEHNVETQIWQRHAIEAGNLVSRFFFRLQEKRMSALECCTCRRATQVIAVSDADAVTLAKMCGISHVKAIPTGVDVAWFSPPSAPAQQTPSDLLFVGSMDWLPNIDGVSWFVQSVLPLIRARFPDCSFTIAGRRPARAVRDLGKLDPRIHVTGTVDDIRPYFWSASVSIVPLRIGGGTRLKIYEAMAAGVPVVSTTIGAEGLDVHSPGNIRVADSPEAFANGCLELLGDSGERARQSAAALALVRERFSWETVATQFEQIVMGGRPSRTEAAASAEAVANERN